jgi:hypothetical protein
VSENVEARLRRFRPTGAPPSLRRRLIVARIRQWTPAAALVAATLLFQLLAFGQHRTTDARLAALLNAAVEPSSGAEPW